MLFVLGFLIKPESVSLTIVFFGRITTVPILFAKSGF